MDPTGRSPGGRAGLSPAADPRAERMVARLAGLATQLREEYLEGISAPRRNALIRDLLQVKTNLLRLEAGAK